MRTKAEARENLNRLCLYGIKTPGALCGGFGSYSNAGVYISVWGFPYDDRVIARRCDETFCRSQRSWHSEDCGTGVVRQLFSEPSYAPRGIRCGRSGHSHGLGLFSGLADVQVAHAEGEGDHFDDLKACALHDRGEFIGFGERGDRALEVLVFFGA